ncbi:hypothetical protein NIES4071_95190 [Calothrix sp. NIES-4071]|nr:hypothetical protein NIES4071_95190 [Calothrix sp. NIES-4071]BAZ63784.1 hypothetical protein NIES4105_95120 [Calothrix sp. NIES-4105]
MLLSFSKTLHPRIEISEATILYSFMRTVVVDAENICISNDPDNLLSDLLTLLSSDYYANQAEDLFAPDGEGIDDIIYLDINIYAYRARQKEDLPECMYYSSIDVINSQIWVISAVGLCYEANPIVMLGEELRYLLLEVKKLRSKLGIT